MQRLKIEEPTAAAQVAAAADALGRGHLAVLPTETVYGLAADPRLPDAVAALAAVKDRAAEQPFTNHLAKADDLASFATAPRRLRRFLDRVWPGPLTIILPGLGGEDVGLRVPAHPFTPSARHQQAVELNRWASQQTLPIIATGDYNFDWSVQDGPVVHDAGFELMTAGGVFSWVRPKRYVKTQDSDSNKYQKLLMTVGSLQKSMMPCV